MKLSDINFAVSFTGTINKAGWNQKVNSYKATLKYNSNKFTINFFQGLGINNEPTIESVMNCLLLDSNCTDFDYDEFCGNFGYELNSESKKVYNNCKAQTVKLNKMFTESEISEMAVILEDY